MGPTSKSPGFPPVLPEEIDDFVKRLPPLIHPTNGMQYLDDAVKLAASYDIDQMNQWKIFDAHSFLQYATGMLYWIPEEKGMQAKEVYYTLCLFYFVLDQPPIIGMQTKIEPESVDTPLTPISNWISMFAMKVGDFMDTEDSLTADSLQSFIDTPEYNMHEAWVPSGDFKTFNQLFSRYLKPNARPIDGTNPDGTDIPEIITWPADSTYEGLDTAEVNSDNTVTITSTVTCKSVNWPITALLRGSKYADDFIGGQWMHAFLGPTDYHRQHAPVGGKILEAKVIQGLCYLEVDMVESKNKHGKHSLRPHRSWKHHKKQPAPPKDAFRNTVDAPDSGGYQFIQTRGCIIIENEVVGKVAVLPIGMAQVSSVKLSVQDQSRSKGPSLPSEVKKGDEISCFQFGGSDIIVVFQAKPGVKITAENGVHYNYGKKLGEVIKK